MSVNKIYTPRSVTIKSRILLEKIYKYCTVVKCLFAFNYIIITNYYCIIIQTTKYEGSVSICPSKSPLTKRN